MKKIYITFLVAAFLGVIQVNGQKRLTEATISYDIVINSDSKKPDAADLLDGATSVIYLKGNSSRSEMVSSLATQSTIIDGRTGNVTILKEYGDQKYMIGMTPTNWKDFNKKYEGVRIQYDSMDKKTIAGYKCEKAIVTLADGTTRFTVYFTRDLMPVNKDFQYMNKDLPGLAMEYEAQQGSKRIKYTVSSINFNPVPQVKFDLPKSGYRIMTYEESLKKGN